MISATVRETASAAGTAVTTGINEENHYHIYTQAKYASDMREIAEGLEFVRSQDRNGKGLKR